MGRAKLVRVVGCVLAWRLAGPVPVAAQAPPTPGERARRAAVLDALIEFRTEWQRAPTRWVGCSADRAFGGDVVAALRPASRLVVATSPLRPDSGCTARAYGAPGVRTIYVRRVDVQAAGSGAVSTWQPRYLVALEINEGGCRDAFAQVELVPHWRRAVGPDPDDVRWLDVQVRQYWFTTVSELSHCACLSPACRETDAPE